MKKLVLLSTDTPHHTYFINFLKKKGISFHKIVFESESVTAPFPIGPFFKEEEDAFEKKHFFKDLPQKLDEDIISFSNINNKECIDILMDIKPDFGVVFGTRKLSKDLIGCFKDGLINVHRGIAEEYRGLDSDLWAIYHKDYDNIGVTIHKVDLTLDTGNVVYQEKLKLKKDMEIFQLRYYTSIISTRLSLKAVQDYLNENLKEYKQEKKGRYYSFMPLVIKQTLIKRFKTYISKLN